MLPLALSKQCEHDITLFFLDCRAATGPARVPEFNDPAGMPPRVNAVTHDTLAPEKKLPAVPKYKVSCCCRFPLLL